MSAEAATRAARRLEAARAKARKPPAELERAARSEGLSLRASGRTCWVLTDEREYRLSAANEEWGQLNELAQRFDRVAARRGIRSYYTSPRAWTSVVYPAGYGPRGEDDYEVKIARGFGAWTTGETGKEPATWTAKPSRQNPPGTRLRIGLRKLAEQVEENEGRLTVRRTQLVLCKSREAARKKDVTARFPNLKAAVKRAAARVNAGRGTAADKELLAKDFARRIRKGR